MNLKEEMKCLVCKGTGELTTMESVYNGSDSHLQAPVGSVACDNCGGMGLEPDEQIVLERIVENLSTEDEEKLQIYFMEDNGELGINKDNCEDLFEGWLENMDLEEIIKILA